jgi:hypothetical protein
MVFRADLSIVQDLFTNISGTRNGLQFRIDFLNFSNLLNKNWGVGQRMLTTQPLISRGADAQGRALYRLRNNGAELLAPQTFEQTADLRFDVFRIQFGLRYNFN